MLKIIHFFFKKLEAGRKLKHHKEEGFGNKENRISKWKRLASQPKKYSKKGKKMQNISKRKNKDLKVNIA